MDLYAYLVQHYLPGRPGLSRDYAQLLTATVARLSEYAAGAVELAAVDRPLLGAWATKCLADGLRPATVNNRLRMVRSLLLAAYDDGLLTAPPRRVKRLRESHLPPEAWTIDQCRRLFDVLRHQPGRIGRVAAADYWIALAATVFWTGARIGAVLASEAHDYETESGGLVLRKQKNGHPVWHPLPGSCREAIERILPESGPIWAWPWHRNLIWVRFRAIVEAACLPCPRTHGQLFYRIRRTTLSLCAAEDPLLAQRQADHSDVRTTMRHYVDPRIARQRCAIDVLPDPMSPPDGNGRPRLRIVR